MSMKKLFVSELDTLLGRRICERFGSTKEFVIYGTVRDSESLANGLPPYVTGIIDGYRHDNVEFKRCVLDCDIIVCPLKDDIVEANAAIKMLSNTAFEVEKTFVLVSSVLTWADTYAAQKAEEEAERQAERQALIDAGEEPDEEEEAAAAEQEPEEPEELPTFGDDGYQKRVSHRMYQHWREVEVLTKQVNSETLHTHVVFAGLQYGHGEDQMHFMMHEALHHRPLPMFTSGSNVIPMIHVDDLAGVVFKAGNSLDPLSQRYILGVDRGNCTHGALVKALNDQMGCGETFPVPPSQHLSYPQTEMFTCDLRFDPSAAFEIHDEEDWVAPDGFVATIEKVVDEYKSYRNVEPVRVILTGPPLSGKSFIAKKIAEQYRINHVTVASAVAAYEAHAEKLTKDLSEYRAAKKAEKRRLEREEQKRVAKEAADEAAALAADEAEAKKAAAAADEEDDDGEGGGPPAKDETTVLEAQDGDESDDEEIEFDDGVAPVPPSTEDADQETDAEAKDKSEEEDAAAAAAADADEGEGEAAPAEDADDDEEDEVLAKMKEDLDVVKKVLTLKRDLAAIPKPADEEEEFVDEGDEAAMEAAAAAKAAAAAAAAEDENVPPPKWRYVDESIAMMMRWFLNEKPCRNQGYVLDGFPKTTKLASLTFMAGDVPLPELEEIQAADAAAAGGDAEEDASGDILAPVEEKLLPEFAFRVECNGQLLLSRVKGAEKEHEHDSLTSFYRRLHHYEKHNGPRGKPTHSVTTWLQSIITNKETMPRGCAVMLLDSSHAATDEGELDRLLGSVWHKIGVPHFYRPTPTDIVAEKQERELEEEASMLAKIKHAEEVARKAAEEEAARQHERAIHDRRYTSIAQEQEQVREMQDLKMHDYLATYVVPSVTKAMSQVVALRPEDPVLSVAQNLFRHQQQRKL